MPLLLPKKRDREARPSARPDPTRKPVKDKAAAAAAAGVAGSKGMTVPGDGAARPSVSRQMQCRNHRFLMNNEEFIAILPTTTSGSPNRNWRFFWFLKSALRRVV
jgi:hypothetical protein